MRELRQARRSRTLQRVPDRAGTPEAFGVQYGGAPGPQTRNWQRAVEQLERNEFVAIERKGKDWKIRRGRRSLDAREKR
jgi:hypothetical protein